MRVGITGHRDLAPRTAGLVAARITEELTRARPPLVGLSSLAPGADQIFAEAVLEAGGVVVAVLPCRGYDADFDDADALRRLGDLLARAHETIQLPFDGPSDDAYLRAGEEVASRCELLLAVWDGNAARGRGGTAQIVGFAREHGVPVQVIWPDGSARVAAPS